MDPGILFGAWWLNRQAEKRFQMQTRIVMRAAAPAAPPIGPAGAPPARSAGMDADEWWFKVDEAAERGLLDKALGLSERALRKWPSDIDLLEQCAVLLEATGRWDDALNRWQKRAHAADDDDSIAPFAWDDYLQALGRDVASRGDSPGLTRERVWILRYLERWDEAERVVEEGLAVYPEDTGLQEERRKTYERR
jgi:tetratricopeptide (TPR) repeat protein